MCMSFPGQIPKQKNFLRSTSPGTLLSEGFAGIRPACAVSWTTKGQSTGGAMQGLNAVELLDELWAQGNVLGSSTRPFGWLQGCFQRVMGWISSYPVRPRSSAAENSPQVAQTQQQHSGLAADPAPVNLQQQTARTLQTAALPKQSHPSSMPDFPMPVLPRLKLTVGGPSLEPMHSSAPAQLPALRALSAASSEGFPSPFSMQRVTSQPKLASTWVGDLMSTWDLDASANGYPTWAVVKVAGVAGQEKILIRGVRYRDIAQLLAEIAAEIKAAVEQSGHPAPSTLELVAHGDVFFAQHSSGVEVTIEPATSAERWQAVYATQACGMECCYPEAGNANEAAAAIAFTSQVDWFQGQLPSFLPTEYSIQAMAMVS